MQDTLTRCEHEVEASRAKLASDLTLLRSPKTFESFTDGLKQDAIETKDRLVDEVRDAVDSKVNRVIEDLKAKAAANPAAALMVGAGVGWYFLRRPPITTALVGLGLFSLLRTQATPEPHAQTGDLRVGQARLKEQAGGLASQAAEQAASIAAHASERVVGASSEIVAAAKEKSAELLETAKDSISRFQQGTRDRVAAGASGLQEQAASMIPKARNVVSSFLDQVPNPSERVVAGAWDSVGTVAKPALTNAEARDRTLLGVAGLAVAAALGFACKKRFADEPSGK